MNIWDPYDVRATGFPPDPHHLQTPVFSSKHRCWVIHAGVGFETSVLVIHAGARLKKLVLGRIAYAFWQSFLGCFVFAVAVNDGIALSSLFCAFPASTFCVCPHPSTRQGEGRGSRWGGLPTFAGVVLVGILVDLAFEVVFVVFDVRSHSCLCLLAIDRQVVGTHGVGQRVQSIFTGFTVLGGAH